MIDTESTHFCIFLVTLCVFAALVVFIFVKKIRQRRVD